MARDDKGRRFVGIARRPVARRPDGNVRPRAHARIHADQLAPSTMDQPGRQPSIRLARGGSNDSASAEHITSAPRSRSEENLGRVHVVSEFGCSQD
jgi:hypothetical protein